MTDHPASGRPAPSGRPWSDGVSAETLRPLGKLTVFRKSRQHDQRRIERAIRAQKICERDHRGPATKTYDR